MSFTLGGRSINSLRMYVPPDGVHSADVELQSADMLSGAAALVAGDLSFAGWIKDGGAVAGVARYHWVAGQGLWETELGTDRAAYQSAAGVLLHNVLNDLPRDIAVATGGRTETLSINVPNVRLGGTGSAYVRPSGPAWNTLRALMLPWYIDGTGVTQIGARSSAPAPLDAVAVLNRDVEDGAWVIAPPDDKYAAWLPGNTIEGERIASMLLVANGNEPVRLHILSAPISQADISHDYRTSIERIIAQQTDVFRFHGQYEYRVKTRTGNSYGLIPAPGTRHGLPKQIDGRELRPGIAGYSADLRTGQSVSVGFEDGDPARPYIRAFEPLYAGMPERVSISADHVLLGGALLPVARKSDPVVGWNITVSRNSMSQVTGIAFSDAAGHTFTIQISAGLIANALPDNVNMELEIGTPSQNVVKA